MVRECPRCGLVSPPTAPQCDCGYDSADGVVRGVDPARSRPWGPMVGCSLPPVGALIGLATALRMFPQREGLGFIFVGLMGVILGGLLGAAVGSLVNARRR